MFMDPRRYFIPNMTINPRMLRSGYGLSRNSNFFSRLFTGIRSFNWDKLLTGTSKTLNVVNQAIPVVRQAKPMVGNVKKLIKLTKVFGAETTKAQVREQNEHMLIKNDTDKIINNNNYPNFFI